MSHSFNDAQKRAIVHKNGPMLVIAGPGSGKTLVITYRVRQLIKECNVKPENILVITFTKAAARQMKDRFERLVQGAYASCTFGTFHSVFYQMLKRAYGYGPSNVLSEQDKLRIIESILNEMGIEYQDEEEFIPGLSEEIGIIKGDMLSLDTYYSTSLGREEFIKLYKCYEEYKRKNRKIDFDDMLLYTYELLVQRPDILNGWRGLYQYILIDEFQDINRIQYEIVKLLAAPRNNLFVVGDDDQSIYGFRGSKPEFMLNLNVDYKNIKKEILNVNYRSTKSIVNSANKLINCNSNRYKKSIITNGSEGRSVNIICYEDKNQEEFGITKEINEFHNLGTPYNSIAVLYRTNSIPVRLVEKLYEHNIPFICKEKIANIYDSYAVKNIIDYINVALGNHRRSIVLRIINKPKRYISRELLTDEIVDFNELLKLAEGKDWLMDNIEEFHQQLNMIRKLKPYAAINYIRKAVGYDEYITEYAKYKRINSDDMFQKLDQVMDAAKNYKTFDDWFDHIEQYGQLLLKNNEKASRSLEPTDSVHLVTMHGAKGLEYDIVFVIDVNEGIVPYKKAVKDYEIEEERRMLYVAMTRAKSILNISYVKSMFNKKMEPSRFISEITKK